MLPIPPQEATKILLNELSSRRMRAVLEKRFGLKGGRKMTLDAIGKEYRITRERVRQIEADALKNLGKDEVVTRVTSLFKALEEHLAGYGGVMAEHHLFSSLAEVKYHPHLALLFEAGKQFFYIPEDNNYHSRWAIDRTSVENAEKIISGVVAYLKERQKPVSGDELNLLLVGHAKEILGKEPPQPYLDAYLTTSKLIAKNPYGEYGLTNWADIRPRGVRDKAYAALVKSGKPLHFREVAERIDKAGWSKRRAHPQTVHNELIKDPRFVLVGRGLYALKEWGYEPGVVREILVSVMKEAGTPLSKDDIVRLVSERRFVKPQTILLNLQNKSLFRRTEDGKYTLV